MLSFDEFKQKLRTQEKQEENKPKKNETTPWSEYAENSGAKGYKAWRDWKGNVNLSNLSTGESERTYQAYNHIGGADSNRAPLKDNLLSDIGQAVGGAMQRQGASYKGAGANLLLSMADLFNGKEEFQPQVGSALWRLSQGAKADIGVANQLMEDSKYGHGKAYGLVMDLTSGAVDLASDALLTAATGGATIGGKLAITAGLGAMGARSFGSGAMEAEEKGMSRGQQFLSGLKSATIEMLTEKIGGPFEKAYGRSALGRTTKSLAERLSKNAGMNFALTALGNFASEGGEEVLSDVLNPLADKLLRLDNGEGWQNLWTSDGFSQMAYDGLVGGLLGFFGGAVEGLSPSERIRAASEGMDNALAASQQGRSIAAELENDKDGRVAQAISNQAAQDSAEAKPTVDQQITPEAPKVSEKAPSVEFNAKPEAEAPITPDTIAEAAPQKAPVESPVEGEEKKTKPIGKKTARDIAFDAWFADNGKNAERNGVEVDASDFTDENAEPSTKEPESAKLEEKQKQTNEERIAKSRESALAQNGIDYGHDPRADLEIDPDTGTYREFEPHDLSEEDWRQYKKDLAQARLLDAVDRWLAKNANSYLDAEYGTLDEKHERLQKALNNYVRSQIDQRQANPEAGEASREVAEANVEEARLKDKQRSQKYTENGYTVVPIGNELFKVTGPGGRTVEVIADSSAEAIQKYNDNLTEESRKAAKERKAKEAELKKMREDVIESGKNPAQIDGSDGKSYEITKQFSNEQQTRYEYVVTELDEDGLPSDREARVFQNRANTNEEAVQYAIDNDLFKEDDYSDLTERSNNEKGNVERRQRENRNYQRSFDKGGVGRAQTQNERQVSAKDPVLQQYYKSSVFDAFPEIEYAQNEWGDDVKVVAPKGWQSELTELVKRITGARVYWATHSVIDSDEPNPSIAFVTPDGDIFFSSSLLGDGSEGGVDPATLYAYYTAAHEVIHHLVNETFITGEKSGKAKTFLEDIFRTANIDKSAQENVILGEANYYFPDPDALNGLTPEQVKTVLRAYMSVDPDFASLVYSETIAKMAGSCDLHLLDGKAADNYDLLRTLFDTAREKLITENLIDRSDLAQFPDFDIAFSLDNGADISNSSSARDYFDRKIEHLDGNDRLEAIAWKNVLLGERQLSDNRRNNWANDSDYSEAEDTTLNERMQAREDAEMSPEDAELKRLRAEDKSAPDQPKRSSKPADADIELQELSRLREESGETESREKTEGDIRYEEGRKIDQNTPTLVGEYMERKLGKENQSDEEKAKSTFGKKYDKVQRAAEDFGKIKTSFDEDSFRQSEEKKDKATAKKLDKFRELFDAAVKTGDVESLFKFYESLASDPDLGNFFNDEVKQEIDNWRNMTDENSDNYNEKASAFVAARAVRKMAHKFAKANEYQQVLKKMNETLAGSKSGMLRKISKSKKMTASVARALARWQVNPDTVFKMIDAFDKGNFGEGYKLAKELQTAHRKKYEVVKKARERFDALKEVEGYEDFIRGKQNVKDHTGREWDMRDALNVVKSVDTIRSTSGKKLGGSDGFAVQLSNGDIEYIDMSDVEALSLYKSLKDGLSPVAKKMSEVSIEAFNDVKELLRDKYFENNGIEIDMVGDADELLSENAKKKRGFEKSVYSPLNYITKDGQVYQFDIAKQDTYSDIPKMLRKRSSNGGAYILIRPYTDVVEGYFEQVANYLAYSTFNEKMRGLGKGSSYTPGLATSLSDAFGKDMGNWYQNYVEDLKTYSNEDDTEGVNSLLRQGRQKLQQGALLFSVSVPMKQISSYWAASGILHPDSLIKNYRVKLLKPKNSSDAATMLASRAMGNLEQSASEAAKDAEKWLGKLKYSSKFIKFAANAINQMDYNTVSNLLSATEYDVLKYQFNNDKSKVGTEEYKAAVEELFQEVVDRSQPNFDKQMRAEYGRTDNEIIRMLSMFRTQQTQNLNLLATAIGEYKAAKGTANQAKATETLKQTIAGQAASAFSLSALTILADMLLHRQKKYEDEDKQIDPTKVLSRLGINAIEASSGTLWFGDTVAKWAIDQLSGGETNEFYGLNLGVVTTLSNAIDAVGSVIQSPTRSNVKYAAGQIATMFGIPLNNAYAFLNSAIMYAKDVAGTNEGDYDDILRYIDAQEKAAKKAEEKAAKQAAKEAEKKEASSSQPTGADILAEAASQKPAQTELNAQEEKTEYQPSQYLKKPYNALLDAGMSSEQSQKVLTEMDTDGNDSVKQSEMIAYWKAHPEDEQYVIAMWNSYGYKTTWEKAKQKAG